MAEGKVVDGDVENLVLKLYDVGAVKFGDFVTKIGIKTPVYFDLRVMVSYPQIMEMVSSQIHALIQKNHVEYDHICGVPYTALPISTLVSIKTNKPMLIRRKETKEYGTKKRIEGHYKNGDTCIIIEDVVTSGSSVADTVKDLENDGLTVTDAFVVLDRQQGGKDNLEKKNIKMHVIVTLTEVLDILFKASKISEEVFNSVINYIEKSKIDINGAAKKNEAEVNETRLKMSFRRRANVTKNNLAVRLFELMEEKETLLCLAADVSTSEELLKLARETGPYICIFKTHFDAISDFTDRTRKQLMELAKNLNFLILEDRKFGDIGNTVSLQYSQIYPWADLVTAHSISGNGVLSGLKMSVKSNLDRGCFLVAELSCDGALIDKDYTERTVKMGKEHLDFVVGFVCQSPDVIEEPYLLQLTPGVKLENGSDSLGQKYNTPEYVVLKKGADIAVVGRGIIHSSNPGKTAKIFKEQLWKAYLQRVNKI